MRNKAVIIFIVLAILIIAFGTYVQIWHNIHYKCIKWHYGWVSHGKTSDWEKICDEYVKRDSTEIRCNKHQ